MKITVISGSPRKISITHRVALFMQKELQTKTQHHINLLDIREHELPFIQNTFEKEENTPTQFHALRNLMLETDAFVFVTPEYNGGYSSALKNLVDHFAKAAFIHKPVGIVTASDGGLGGVRAAMQIEQLVCGIFGIPSPYLLVVSAMQKRFDAEGTLIDLSFQTAVDTFTREFIWLTEKLCDKK